MATEAQNRAAAARRAEAQASARTAEANARASEAAARAKIAEIEATTKQKQISADANRESARIARNDAARPYQIGSSLAALPVGVGVGYGVSKLIERRHTAFVKAVGTEVTSLANVASPIIDKIRGKPGAMARAKLQGVVRAAQGLDLRRAARGPLGIVPAGLLLAEGAFSRFALAPRIEDPRARAIVEGVGTASVFAATNLIGERMIQSATPKAMLPAKAVATIEAARNVVVGTKAAANLVPLTSTAAPAVARAGLTVGRVLARGLPALTVAMAAVDAVNGYRAGGVKGAIVGVADGLTFGAASKVVKAFSGGAPTESPRLSSGRAALARAAAVRATVEMRSSSVSSRAAAVKVGSGNGLVTSYTRIQNGRSVRVQGYSRK